ncbi:MAG: hypothetical protein V4440_04965, partial [Pseudomonadota bacterium]
RKRLRDREIGLRITDAALNFLTEVGYDPVYGARPLKRAIQQYLENALAQALLAGKYMPGDEVIVDRAKKGKGKSENGDLEVEELVFKK